MGRRKSGLFKGKNSYFDRELFNNSTELQFYIDQFMNLAISSFKWSGFPDTVDTRWLEILLFSQGSAVFFEDDVIGSLTLAAAPNGPLNVYNIPTRYNAYGTGYNKQCDLSDSVLIWNNPMHTNSEFTIAHYCRLLWEYDQIININVKAQKTPILLLCSEDQRLTLENLYMKYEGNEPVIHGDKNLDWKGLQVVKTDAPFIANDLYDLKVKYYNEALTYLGITNIIAEKKERLIKDEVFRSMGGVLANRQVRLAEREKACDAINKMFGLNVSVEFVDIQVDNMTPQEQAELPDLSQKTEIDYWDLQS